MSNEWSERVQQILLPGEVLEDDPPKQKRKRKKRASPPSITIQRNQRALGAVPDGISGPQTQAAMDRAYAEKRVILVKNMTTSTIVLPGNLGMVAPTTAMAVVLPTTDVLRDAKWTSIVQRAFIQIYLPERPPRVKLA